MGIGPITLPELIKLGKERAERSLVKDKLQEMAPLWHLISPEGGKDMIIMTPWNGDYEKQLAVAQVKQISHEMGAIAVCFSTECWMLDSARMKTPLPPMPDTSWHRKRMLENMPRPSQSPDRIEAVIIIAHDGKETLISTLQTIRDKPGGRVISLVPYFFDSGNDTKYESWMLKGMIRRSDSD